MKQDWPEMGRRSDRGGVDEEVRAMLTLVDPASTDPNYWFRFRAWVMDRASVELARRRLTRELTVGDVLWSWSRALVPAAAVAAAVAGMALLRPPPTVAQAPVGVEEILVAGLEDEPIPAALSSEASTASVAFASEAF